MKTLKVITLITVTSVLLFTGCTKDKESITPLEDIPVKVIVNDFSVAQEGFAGSKSASSLSAYTNVKSITLAFYNVGGNEQYNVTQQRSDTTTYGSYRRILSPNLMYLS